MADNVVRECGSLCATSAQDIARLSECLIRHFDRIVLMVACHTSSKLSQRVSTEDLVHEVIVEALEHHGTFEYRGEAGFVRWISTVAHRVVCDAVRTHARVPPALSIRTDAETNGDVRPSHVPGQTRTPSSIVARDERCRRVREALATLHENDRTVIRMVQLEGRSLGDVAGRMGCSRDAAGKRLARALSRLGEGIAHCGHEHDR